MSLNKSIAIFIRFCQFCGLAPYSFTESQWKLNRSFEMLTILLAVVIVISSIAVSIFNEYFFQPNEHKIANIIFVAMLITINIHAFIILIEIFVKRHQHIKLLDSFQKLEKLLQKTDRFRLNCTDIKRMCHRHIIFWFIEIISMMFVESLILIKSGEFGDINYVIVYLIPYFLCKLNYIQAMSYISILRKNAEALDDYSKHLMEKSEQKMIVRPFLLKSWKTLRPKKNKIDEKVFILLRKVHSSIWECSVIINNIMYWSMPMGILNEFLLMVFNLFWFVTFLLSKMDNDLLVFAFIILWIIITVINVLFITVNCMNTCEVVS